MRSMRCAARAVPACDARCVLTPLAAPRRRRCSRENDWGFTQLLELSELADPAKGWVGDDGALTVEVNIQPAACAVRGGAVTCMACTRR